MPKTYFKDKLIVVSNREPYSMRKGVLEKTVGGLVSALDPVMRASHGVWVAAGGGGGGGNGGLGGVGANRVMVPPEDPSYTMRLVPLSGRDVEGYYHGYSNRFLWPLCHITPDRIHLRKSYWQSYKKVNSLFADAVVEEAKKDSTVWLQDYHLSLAAGLIARKRPDLRLAIFWHIPWPPYDVFRACPNRREILEGMLANDLVGFQLEAFKINFMGCVYRELGAAMTGDGFIVYNGHITRVEAFPISVDFDWFEQAASTNRAERFFERFKKEKNLEGQLIGLGVDRLDYTKGILKGLDALEFFFKKYPRFRGRFTFVQIAVPTRKAEPFLSYMELVRKKVKKINAKFSTNIWRPVEYIESRFSHTDLAALYRGADLALISSIYDGMNLVAKEFVSSQVDLKGSLLVSEFAGASQDMPGAVVINPYDTEGCADAIKDAITMSKDKKRESLTLARDYVRTNDIYKWVDSFLEELKRLK